jgi:hypothetical protein
MKPFDFKEVKLVPLIIFIIVSGVALGLNIYNYKEINCLGFHGFNFAFIFAVFKGRHDYRITKSSKSYIPIYLCLFVAFINAILYFRYNDFQDLIMPFGEAIGGQIKTLLKYFGFIK